LNLCPPKSTEVRKKESLALEIWFRGVKQPWKTGQKGVPPY